MSRLSISLVVIFALALAGGAALVWHYGAEEFAVQLASGFVAALGAFVLALAWERDREAKQLAAEAEQLIEERGTEVRRRLATVREELRENRQSLDDIHTSVEPSALLNVALRAGAWTASAPALAELIADYDLTAALARYYDRIEEVRWRLRLHTELVSGHEVLDEMTRELVAEVWADTDSLIEDIDAEIDNPNVQLRGLIHRGSGSANIGVTATIDAKVIRQNEES